MNHTIGNAKAKPVILVVLGPHRSGTSALTGVLGQLGANLPQHLMPANDGNAAGYFESSRIKGFNDRLLAELGSTWHDVGPLDLTAMSPQVRDSFLDEAVAVLKGEFAEARIPLLKDPRICRLLGFWQEAFDRFGYRPIYIHTHRNPLETAQSLAARHPLSVEMGLLIWLRHVLDAEAATRTAPRAFTNYQALLDGWRPEIARIETTTGFTFHRKTPTVLQQIDAFLTDSLRHQHRQPADVHRSALVSDLVRETFDIFEGAGQGVSAADQDRLDGLRARLDNAVGMMTPLLQALGRDTARCKALETQVSGLEEQIAGERADLARLQDDRAREAAGHLAQIAELEGALRQRSLEAEQWFETNRQLTTTLETLQAEQQRLETEVGTRTETVQTLEANIQARFDEMARLSDGMMRVSQKLDAERALRLQLAQGNARLRREKASLSAKVAHLETALRKHRAGAKARQTEVRRLQGTVKTLQQTAQAARNRTDALLASTSWRVTGPLRRLVRLWRSFGRR